MLRWALVDEQDPVELFGVGESLGTIEEAKTANLMVTNGTLSRSGWRSATSSSTGTS
jgi:hypothetical protein